MGQPEVQIFNAVDEIEYNLWQDLGCEGNTYFTPQFFKAYELANDDIEFKYIFIKIDGKAVAFAYTQLVTIGIKTITKNISISSFLKRILNKLFCNNQLRILFFGNVFLSGEYGTFLKQGEDKVPTFHVLAEAVNELARSTKRLHAIFVKDFERNSLYITDLLLDHGYTAMQVEPNMIIYLDPEWRSFEDYKNELKSKYRVKANKADSKSQFLEVRHLEEHEIAKYKADLQALYENTISNANFNAQVLNLNTYVNLKRTYKDDFILIGYFSENQLVGFLSAMINGTHLDAHFIGLDYNLNKQYAIYPRILNDYVRLGIEHNCVQINLGRTASEIKTTLGAVPEDLTCYIRHKRNLPNVLMKPFIKKVKIKTFKQHYPFKSNKEAFADS